MKNNEIYVENKIHRGWHIYSKKSQNHYFFGEEEYIRLKNNDFSNNSEFNNFLKSISFFKKKHVWYDYKIPIISTNKIIFKSKILLYLFFCMFILALMISIIPLSNKYFPKLDFNVIESIVVVLISLLLHEFSHFYLGNINKIFIPTLGLNLKWGIPLPYVDLTGVSYLTNEIKKVQIFVSGIAVNVYLCILFYILSYFTKLNIFSIGFYINLTVIFSNLMFYLKLDGYYILESFLGVKLITYKIKDFQLDKFLLIKIYIYCSFIIFIMIIIGGIFNHGIWN